MTALPPNWVQLEPAEALSLEAELRREVPRTHLLYGRNLRAAARHAGHDEVLFISREGGGEVFCVHLTWAIEKDPEWPWTESYRDQSDFAVRWPRGELDDA